MELREDTQHFQITMRDEQAKNQRKLQPCNTTDNENGGNESETVEILSSSVISSNMVQIKAQTEDEMMRRISAFMQNKRNEINERNIREFISPFSSDADSSCARVESVYIHREGGKSHITLKKVNNVTGPQTRLPADEDTSRLSDLPFLLQRAEAVEERLANMEAHLDLKTGHQDIYKRLKSLEKRISYLEGISPEYFVKGLPKEPKLETNMVTELKSEKPKQDMNLSDINLRIRQLKEILQQKAMEKHQQTG